MNAPEMEVIRFNEADVIVASGAYLYKFNDGVQSNAYVQYGNDTFLYDQNNKDALFGLLPNGKDTWFNNGKKTDTIENLYDMDANNSADNDWDGYKYTRQ